LKGNQSNSLPFSNQEDSYILKTSKSDESIEKIIENLQLSIILKTRRKLEIIILAGFISLGTNIIHNNVC